ncbi:MAG: hypothetical protein Kow0096_09130 [Thiohalomonadaceae bacterium]
MSEQMKEMCEEMVSLHGKAYDTLKKGAVMAGTTSILRHPLVWFALGAAAGYYGYKYRKEIAAAVAKGTDMGRDFVLQQRESLSDLLEEAREAEEGTEATAKK